MKFRVLPYRQGSKGAKALAAVLGGKVLKLQGSSYQPAPTDVIINWGNVGNIEGPLLDHLPMLLNDPCVIRNASNKRTFFNAMVEANLQGIIPSFWTSADAIPEDAFPVVCRTVLAGHSGDGIVIAASRGELVPAPLYVRYVKKTDEYRIHVGVRGPNTGYPQCEGDPYAEIISIQRKARRNGFENPNWQVRNHANGFIYARANVNPPPSVLDAAKRALLASGLDFGAVDVIWNAGKAKPYVLEINTAPGLEGTTVADYAKFFRGEGD